jgi:hypothetical protein
MKTKYIKQFEMYLNGELDPGEKAAFEDSLGKDPGLNASFQEYLSIYQAIRDKESLELRLKLKEIREEQARGRNKSDFFRQNYNWIWMAALIAVVIGLTAVLSVMIKDAGGIKPFLSGVTSSESHDHTKLDRELLRFAQRHVNFILESPEDSIYFNRKATLVFKWTVNSTDPLILELIDRDGRIVFSSGKPVQSPYVVRKRLPSGLLVYRFRTEKESYHIGFLLMK